MDVHYVEPFRSTETIYLIDEPQRHAGSASNGDTNRRIDLLYRLIGPFQKLGIRLGARRFPEHRVIGFVPDLDDWNAPSIVADDPANVLFPLIQMLVGRRCPRHRISENRQRLNPRRLALCHNPVQFRKIPYARCRLDRAPVKVAAHPPESRLTHHLTGLRRRLVARYVRTGSIRTVECLLVRNSEQSTHAKQCIDQSHFH